VAKKRTFEHCWRNVDPERAPGGGRPRWCRRLPPSPSPSCDGAAVRWEATPSRLYPAPRRSPVAGVGPQASAFVKENLHIFRFLKSVLINAVFESEVFSWIAIAFIGSPRQVVSLSPAATRRRCYPPGRRACPSRGRAFPRGESGSPESSPRASK